MLGPGQGAVIYQSAQLESVETVMHLAFLKDGSILSAGQYRGVVRLWDFAGAARSIEMRGHLVQVRGIQLLPDHRTPVTVAESIRLWDLITQRELSSLNNRETSYSPQKKGTE